MTRGGIKLDAMRTSTARTYALRSWLFFATLRCGSPVDLILILVLPIAFRKLLNDLIDLGSRKSDGRSG
jgi:hypothetical protein